MANLICRHPNSCCQFHTTLIFIRSFGLEDSDTEINETDPALLVRHTYRFIDWTFFNW